MIAIFSHRRATEADRVIRHLKAAGCEPVRLNTGHTEAAVSIELSGEVPTLCAAAVCDGRGVRAAEIQSAWMHQQPPTGPLKLRGIPSGVAADSSRFRLWEAFTESVPEQHWLTPPTSLKRAGNKLFQYRCASEAGLSVPHSLASNDPDAIRSYLNNPSVMKYLGDTSHLWAIGHDGFAALTRTASVEEVDDQALLASPTLFQRMVDTEYEIRVVAIRGHRRDAVFAAAGTKPDGVIDIRLADDAMRGFRPMTLPHNVETQFIAAMARMDVGFCSADLLCDADGQHWFIDLNATGAWWWIDDLYDREITCAISEALQAMSDA